MSNLSMSLDRRFQIKQNGSTVRTEILAGITTFMTMAYILAVNHLCHDVLCPRDHS